MKKKNNRKYVRLYSIKRKTRGEKKGKEKKKIIYDEPQLINTPKLINAWQLWWVSAPFPLRLSALGQLFAIQVFHLFGFFAFVSALRFRCSWELSTKVFVLMIPVLTITDIGCCKFQYTFCKTFCFVGCSTYQREHLRAQITFFQLDGPYSLHCEGKE